MSPRWRRASTGGVCLAQPWETSPARSKISAPAWTLSSWICSQRLSTPVTGNRALITMPKILHFADAHIDMANYGRHDPQSGLPLRVIDFLNSLDTIVNTAIEEHVDLVLFAGDAYKDRSSAPTYQREWGRRIMRLSKAGIPVVLLVGNHDLSPALGRAHALDAFDTFEVPNVYVVDRPVFLGPQDLNGLPLQILALPWISRSGLVSHLGIPGGDPSKIYEEVEKRISELLQA